MRFQPGCFFQTLTDSVVLGPLLQEGRVVDPLCPGQDLLPPHEHVVGVGPLGVVGVGHGVERADGQGELVKDVEIGVVLGLDQSGKKWKFD